MSDCCLTKYVYLIGVRMYKHQKTIDAIVHTRKYVNIIIEIDVNIIIENMNM